MKKILEVAGLFGTPARTGTLVVIQMLGETHASEVAQLLGISLSQAQRAINSFEQAGAVVGAFEGNTRRVKLNPRYPYRRELEALLTRIGDDDAVLQAELAKQRRRPRRSGKER